MQNFVNSQNSLELSMQQRLTIMKQNSTDDKLRFRYITENTTNTVSQVITAAEYETLVYSP